MENYPPSESDVTPEQWKERLEAEHEAAEHYANERDDLRHRLAETEEALKLAEKKVLVLEELAEYRMQEIKTLWVEINLLRAKKLE